MEESILQLILITCP